MIRTIDGSTPDVHHTAWIAPDAVLAGAVTIHAEASVWYTAVLRADVDSITVGSGSNIQDGTIVHADPGFPVTIGEGVSVGHRAVLHGCTVEDDALIGMGAIVLNGAVIGRGSLVAAGAVILEGTKIPPGSLVAGVPAKVRRELTSDEQASTRRNAADYRALHPRHAR
ncbi:gamma carbonic anhydrase family protein [Saccharomonospora sp. NPDC046836]|uniref:gamma carbonic anhydrase family protein n=1 Tax=Saccharomonospora sp. NPDC046836 TaxID=3156921 RepID=UPI0033FF2975